MTVRFATHVLTIVTCFKMSWGLWSAQASHDALVNGLKFEGIIKSKTVADAMLKVDRANYAPYHPYIDTPQGIGCGQTISAPHMHGYALEKLHDNLETPGARILDVGSGSGYLSAVMARFTPDSTVIGIDIYPELIELSKRNAKKADRDLIEEGRVKFFVGDGWKGWVAGAPYDAIHVGAAANSIPEKLALQLKVGGRMFIPVGSPGDVQRILLIKRIKGDEAAKPDISPMKTMFHTDELIHVQYVPLVKLK